MTATVAQIKPAQQTAVDDGVREVHGVRIGSDYDLTLYEESGLVYVCMGHAHRSMGPARARYLARKLHRLARRIEQRELVGREA